MELKEKENESKIERKENSKLEETLKDLEEKIRILTEEEKIQELNNTITQMKEDKRKEQEQEKKRERENALSKSTNISPINSTSRTISSNEFYLLKFAMYSPFSKGKKDNITLNTIKQCLQKDILDYQSFTKHTITQTQTSINELLDLLQQAVNIISKDYEVKLYGSRATNLCLSWSDIDVVIMGKDNNTQQDTDISFLDKLNALLNQQSWVCYINYIKRTKVPIIKITTKEKYNYIQIDISFENVNHCGLKCVDLVKEYLMKYEALEPLAFAVKTMLKFSSLNDPYTGGISSYGVILMIVGFLKREIIKGRTCCISELGDIMVDFLYHYGGKPNTNYINVNNIDEYDFNASMRPFDLFIIDPLNKENNVGKSTFQYINVKSMFLIALQSLKEECYCGCHYHIKENDKEDAHIEHIEHNMLNKMFNAVKRSIPTN